MWKGFYAESGCNIENVTVAHRPILPSGAGNFGCPARLLLRLINGRWPRQLPPASPREAFHRDLLEGYDRWMEELRGLATETRGGAPRRRKGVP